MEKIDFRFFLSHKTNYYIGLFLYQIHIRIWTFYSPVSLNNKNLVFNLVLGKW